MISQRWRYLPALGCLLALLLIWGFRQDREDLVFLDASPASVVTLQQRHEHQPIQVESSKDNNLVRKDDAEKSSSHNHDSKFMFSSHDVLTAPDDSVPIFYQCHGPLYTTFIQQLRLFCQEQVTMGLKSLSWGKPANSLLLSNRTIFFFGKPHTRKQAMALLGQYAGDITGFANVARAVDRDSPRRVERRFDLRHKISI